MTVRPISVAMKRAAIPAALLALAALGGCSSSPQDSAGSDAPQPIVGATVQLSNITSGPIYRPVIQPVLEAASASTAAIISGIISA